MFPILTFPMLLYTHYCHFIFGKANTFLTLKMTLSIQMIQFRSSTLSSATLSKCPELITLTKYLPTLFLLWLLSTITGFYSPLYLLTNLLETSYLKMTLNSVESLIKITLFTNIIKTLTKRDLNPSKKIHNNRILFNFHRILIHYIICKLNWPSIRKH